MDNRFQRGDAIKASWANDITSKTYSIWKMKSAFPSDNVHQNAELNYNTYCFDICRVNSEQYDPSVEYSIYIPQGAVVTQGREWTADELLSSATPAKRGDAELAERCYFLAPKYGELPDNADDSWDAVLVYFLSADSDDTPLSDYTPCCGIGILGPDNIEDYSPATISAVFQLPECTSSTTVFPLATYREKRIVNLIKSPVGFAGGASSSAPSVESTPGAWELKLTRDEKGNISKVDFENRYTQIGGYTYYASQYEAVPTGDVVYAAVCIAEESSEGMTMTAEGRAFSSWAQLGEFQKALNNLVVPIWVFKDRKPICDLRRMPYITMVEAWGAENDSGFISNFTSSGKLPAGTAYRGD